MLSLTRLHGGGQILQIRAIRVSASAYEFPASLTETHNAYGYPQIISAMSACLEIAAGAFAVVGAADVIARTAREVYAFLCDVVDAPENIDRLRTTVNEITLLIETTHQCLKALGGRKQSAATLASLDTATRGLRRELQSLKSASTKFKGNNKTWSRIKYVLDDKKVSKALLNLERSKTMLGNALLVACK